MMAWSIDWRRMPQKILTPHVGVVGAGLGVLVWRFFTSSPTLGDYLEVIAAGVIILVATRWWTMRGANESADAAETERPFRTWQVIILVVGVIALLSLYRLDLEPYALLIFVSFGAGVLRLLTWPYSPKTAERERWMI
ncbi:MAG: hypothetical protein GDA50_07930 [Alphaproteobacteria bacterium GM202ARS2]|nr:hypothetical protein [Alphaproteobacteria bacterium GM202ARS2]